MNVDSFHCPWHLEIQVPIDMHTRPRWPEIAVYLIRAPVSRADQAYLLYLLDDYRQSKHEIESGIESESEQRKTMQHESRAE